MPLTVVAEPSVNPVIGSVAVKSTPPGKVQPSEATSAVPAMMPAISTALSLIAAAQLSLTIVTAPTAAGWTLLVFALVVVFGFAGLAVAVLAALAPAPLAGWPPPAL